MLLCKVFIWKAISYFSCPCSGLKSTLWNVSSRSMKWQQIWILKYSTAILVLVCTPDHSLCLSLIPHSSVLLQNALSPTTETMEKTLSTASLKMAPFWSFLPVVLHQRPCQLCCGTRRTLRPAMRAGGGCCGPGRSGWPREWHRRTKATTLWETAWGRSCPAAPSLSAVSRDRRWEDEF